MQNETGSVVFDGRPLDGLIAHQRTRLGLARSFQLPKPFHTLDLVDNLRVPLLYTVNARHGTGAIICRPRRSRSAATSCCGRSASPTRRGGCRAT